MTTTVRLGLFLAALAAPALPRLASACGCFTPPDPSVPIVQAGERILFAHAGGKVTAHIQIQYQGEADQFGWILPLPTVPEMKLGTQELFDQLIGRTQPKYVLERVFDPSCYPEEGDNQGGFSGGADGGASAPPSPGGGPLVLRDQIGPYDYAVLRADDREAMFTWLADNRFFVPTGTENAVGPYIRPGAYFLALKLLGGRGTGDLQPVVVEYESDRPMIPIVLTSVAANPDMGVQVWVLGEHRAIPVNYRHTVINEALIDWAAFGANYVELVIAATNEAPDGQSFVTEFAGDSARLRDVLAPPGRFGDLTLLRTMSEASQYARYLEYNGYAALPNPLGGGGPGGPIGPGGPPFGGQVVFDSALRSILERYVTMPPALRESGVAEDDYYAQLGYYLNDFRSWNAQLFQGWEDRIDAPAITAELEERIVRPTLEADALFDAHPYLTRLFTTLDPQEMTVDPVFDLNPDLPDYPNEHRATMTITCLMGGGRGGDQPRILRLANGRRLFFRPEESDSVWVGVPMPSSQRTERLLLEGAPQVDRDNTAAIDEIIGARNRAIAGEYDGWDWGPSVSGEDGTGTGGPRPGGAAGPDDGPMPDAIGRKGGCAASVPRGISVSVLILFGALGLVLRTRRRP